MHTLLAVALLAAGPSQDERAAQIIPAVLNDPATFGRLRELTDEIGPRLSGSPGAAAAVQWALRKFHEDAVSAQAEPVDVPHWVRGDEVGYLPPADGRVKQPIALTALGNSAPTPESGLTAEVIEVSSIKEAQALGARAAGKIVLFQHEMKVSADYGKASELRSRGANAVAKLGAAAMLVRSAATVSMRSPHTGVTVFDEGVAPIPAAAISLEDSDLIHRLLQRGPVQMHLRLSCRTMPDAPSHNVVAEVRGSGKPDEIVVMGAHLDSWDLATGAIDDGAGVAMVIEALRTLQRLPEPLRPRRTVRAVLFMNEENGSAGSKGYALAHASELAKHVAAIEMDSGGGKPVSVNASTGAGGQALLGPWLAPLQQFGITNISEGAWGGADVGRLGREAQVPFVDVRVDSSRYFEWHHSAADTLDKIDPKELAQSAAALAWVAYALASDDATLTRVAPKARE